MGQEARGNCRREQGLRLQENSGSSSRNHLPGMKENRKCELVCNSLLVVFIKASDEGVKTCGDRQWGDRIQTDEPGTTC